MRIDPFAHGMAKAQARKMTDNAVEAWEEAGRQKNLANAYLAHFVAKEAEAEYLLELLDEAHGGPENNPARKKAYKEDTKLRIPTGKRKGEIPEVRDHVFYTAMKKRFENKEGIRAAFKNWFDVIRLTKIFD